MKMLTKSLLCAGMIFGCGLYASAFNLVSPEPGSTTEVAGLKTISLKWDEDVFEFPEGEVTLEDASGEVVSRGTADYDWDDYSAYTVTFNPAVITPGTYFMVVPANMAPDNTNPEYRLAIVVVAGTQESPEPTEITPANGSELIQSMDVSFSSIAFSFGNAKALVVDESKISLTNQDGTPVDFTLGGFYEEGDPMLNYMPCPFLSINFNNDGDMPSGTYTLLVNPGAFTTTDGSTNENKIVLEYYYTKTKADADPTPLEIQTALMGGAIRTGSYGVYNYTWVGEEAKEVTPDMPVGEFVGVNNVADGEPGTAFLLTFNHGAKSEYVEYQLIDVETNEIDTRSECIKQEDGSFLLPWASTTKLYDGKEYALEFHTYNNVYEKVEFGDGARLTFKGTTEPFHYSSAQFVTVVPTSGETLSSVKQNKITVLFSQPVKATAKISLGSGMSQPTECVAANELGEEFDNVWYVYIPTSIMLTYDRADISVVAYGEDGNIVAGNNGSEEGFSNCSFEYSLTLCQPRIMLGQTNSNVAEINTFTVYADNGSAINTSYMDYPYVINDRGETVATINMQYAKDEWGDDVAYKVLRYDSDDEWERNPLELEFQMTPAIKEKGKYTLVFPDVTFVFGTGMDGDNSVEQNFTYYVVDYYPVTYCADNSSIELAPVEAGKSVNLDIKVNDGWKLSALYLNDEDVTADVADGHYQSAPVYAATTLKAEYSFDGVILIPTGIDDVVSDLNLRGWSTGNKLFVAGLKGGQIVNVYSLGGSLMATSEVAEGNDTMEFAVVSGTYIVTVKDGQQTVALKLICK